MDPATYDWVPVEGAPGVAEKLLGVFTERRSEVGHGADRRRRLLHGARQGHLRRRARRGTVGGKAMRASHHGLSRRRRDRDVAAREPTELLHFGLPDLTGVRMPEHDRVPAEAAE